jgi:hypothetical protein
MPYAPKWEKQEERERQLTSIPAEIRTSHVRNKSIDRCRCANPLGLECNKYATQYWCNESAIVPNLLRIELKPAL